MSARGIYLVANARSEKQCANLVYSIRNAGCGLPIRLIPFGGKPVQSDFILNEVEICPIEDFSTSGQELVNELAEVLKDCPHGFLYRFLAWFGDWDEFLYSDNDIVALTNWERLFQWLPGYDLLHADEEYTTWGKYNYDQPEKIEEIFGEGGLLSAMTAGHFLARRDPKLVGDLRKAARWFQRNPAIPKKHDQALLHVASLIGNWKMLNLCKPPHNWLSSWAGDYKNPLALIHAIQAEPLKRISHLHFSGGVPVGTEPTADFLSANLDPRQRIVHLTTLGVLELGGWITVRRRFRQIRNGLRRRWKTI